jgi:hypothetical protein
MYKIKNLFIIFITTIIAVIVFINSNAYAQTFEVIPDSSDSNIWSKVENIAEWGKVWDKYKETAKNWDLSLWDQFASGIMTWDTILDYAVYLIKFIWQLALLAWALWIIYYGYVKATEHLKGGWKLTKVILWILVISFAYVIVKMIWSMFVS